MADRYAYLPLVGIFIMVCWFLADWSAQLRLSPVLMRTASVVVLIALALLSHRQVSYWNDHVTLWTHALEVTQNNWIAENNLGTALLKSGLVEEAIPHFRTAAALDPTDPNSIMNIGTYEQMHGNLSAAIADYRKSAQIARNPKTKARAYNNLGYACKDNGDLTAAKTSFQHAVEADPEFTGAWISLGLMAQRLGDLHAAISAYQHALQVHASDFGYLLLAQALDKNGDKQQANAARQSAALMSNNLVAAQSYVDKLLSQ
jgi:tetratricopeptide (TPR) repeat protein